MATEVSLLPPHLVDLGRRAGGVLRSHGWHVAVAESCTGGLLGAVLTAVPGSSEYMLGGVIAYDNNVKVLLGVDARVLESVGAVSAAVATSMASSVRLRLGAQVGVGITGVAGPGGDPGGKPAGLVFVAVDAAGSARVVRLEKDRGRDGNRQAAVETALTLILELG